MDTVQHIGTSFRKDLLEKGLVNEKIMKMDSAKSKPVCNEKEDGLANDEIFDLIIKELNPASKKKAHSLNKTLASFGLYMLINQCGIRKIRNKIDKNWTNKSWKRLSDKIKESAMTLKELPPLKIVSDIQLALEKFEKYDWHI